MKKLLTLFALIMGFVVQGFAQYPTQTVTLSDTRTEAKIGNTLTVALAFNPPHRDTTFIANNFGQIIIRPADSLAYISTGLTAAGVKHWSLFGSNNAGSGAQWGVNLTGNISTQTDLQLEFNTKQNILPVGDTNHYWGADGSLRVFPTIPVQLNLTVPPGGNLSLGGVYPNLTIANTLTRLSQLTNDPGYLTSIPTITVSGDASGSGTTTIPIVLANVGSAGTCTLCTITFDAKGRELSYSNGSGSAPVTSVFSRTGVVVAATGDYTAAQVTNAVSTIGSYTNPSWLVSIPWTKITATPTTISGYGITDALVNTFNTRSGSVTLSSSDVTTALGYTPVTNARTLTINGTTYDLTANRSWTVTGTGTLSRISPIDSLGSTANGIQISGGNLVPSSVTSSTPGMMDPTHWRVVDSIYNRILKAKITLGHAGAGKWGSYSSPLGDSLYVKNWANGKWTIANTASDSSNHYDVDSGSEHAYWNNYYLPLTSFITVNGTAYNLSTNPSISISGGGTSDTVTTSAAGLMSTYVYNKTLHPLITWNDSAVAGNIASIYSNGDSLKAHNFRFTYGFRNVETQAVSYVIIDSTLFSSIGNLWHIRDSLGQSFTTSLQGKQSVLSGSGYPKFNGTSISYLTPAGVAADLPVFTTSLNGVVPTPASALGATYFLNAAGGWTVPPGGGSSGVSTFNGRNGAVVPTTGDYTAAQVTNAVATNGTYSNPSWITALAWSVISSKPTTISGYGITDALVNTFNGRNGTVVPTTGDYTAAQVTNAISSASTYSNPSWITALAWSKISGTPTTLSGYGITDPVITGIGTPATSGYVNGATTSGSNLILAPTDGTNPGMITGGAQTIGGAKTLTAQLTANSGIVDFGVLLVDNNYLEFGKTSSPNAYVATGLQVPGTSIGSDYYISSSSNNGSSWVNLLHLYQAGKVQFPQYGTGGMTGTPAYWLTDDASGNVIESAISLAWSKITGTPTTLSGYGITDPVVITSGSYSNPSWITGLAWSKISGTPTTLSGYGITDPVVVTSGSYGNPSWITSLAYGKLTGTPTIPTLAYGQYAPTISNIGSSFTSIIVTGSGGFQYTQIGNEVTVYGELSINENGGGNNYYSLTLPVSTATSVMIGSGSDNDGLGVLKTVQAVAGSNVIQFTTSTGGSTSNGHIQHVSFRYNVL